MRVFWDYLITPKIGALLVANRGKNETYAYPVVSVVPGDLRPYFPTMDLLGFG
jgi:hypothetical protein